MPPRKGASVGQPFDPEGDGYDIGTAREAGLEPSIEPGENFGHMGSVAPTTARERAQYKLPKESYLLLKGRKHESFDKAIEGERVRGFEIKKFGKRYFSVPISR